jgi:hypothetical protein
MRYQVTRTYIDSSGEESTMTGQQKVQVIEAASAAAAAAAFVSEETCRLVGEIQQLPGDEATATCQSAGHVYVIRAFPVEE